MRTSRAERDCGVAFHVPFLPRRARHPQPRSKNTPTCTSHPPAPRNTRGPNIGVNRRSALAFLIFASASTCVPPSACAEDYANLSDEQWRERLSPEEYVVLRKAGTERPFTSMIHLRESRPGVFACKGCGTALFTTATKFDSGTGWPSFYAPIPKAVKLRQTNMDRILLQREVLCRTCSGHLGHVFHDGPKPTGDRYCINGVVLAFKPSQV